MMPQFTLNYLAVIVAVIICVPIGAIWYGPLFGKTWAAEVGLKMDRKPTGAEMGRSIGISTLGSFFTVWVFAHSIKVWMASSWGLTPDAPSYVYALSAAIWTWLGFFLPVQMNRVAWEMKSWKLVAINASYELVRLLIIGFLLAYWP